METFNTKGVYKLTNISRNNVPTETELQQYVTYGRTAVTLFKNKGFEKALMYVVGLLASTNVLGQVPISTSLKEWLVGGAAVVLGAIHLSTPVTPKA